MIINLGLCDNTSVDERRHGRSSVSAAPAADCSTVSVEEASASGAVVIDDDKRQKNRSAARKCREKRLERQRLMRQEVTDVAKQNARLELNVRRLRSHVQQLQSLLAEHRLGPCRLYSSSASTVTSLHTSTTAVDFDEQMMNDVD